jgi:hypothetical protein
MVLSGGGHCPDVGLRIPIIIAILSASAVSGGMTWFAASEAETILVAMVAFLFCEFGERGLIYLQGIDVHSIGVWSGVSGLEGSILEEIDREVASFQVSEFHSEI